MNTKNSTICNKQPSWHQRLVRRFRVWLFIKAVPADIATDCINAAEAWFEARNGPSEYRDRLALIRLLETKFRRAVPNAMMSHGEDGSRPNL